MIFSGSSHFLHQQNLLPWYSWNLVERGVEHHQTNKQTKRVIRSCISKDKQKQYGKRKRTKDDLQNTTQQTKDWATGSSLKTGKGVLRCSGRVSSSCSTSGTGCELVLLFNFHFIIVNNLHWYLLYIIYCLFLVTEWTMAFPSNVNVLRTCQKIAYFPMRYLSTRGKFTMISPFCGTVSYNCSIIGLQAIIEQ